MDSNTLEMEFKNVVKNLKIPNENIIISNFKVRYLHEKRQEILELLVNILNKSNLSLLSVQDLESLKDGVEGS